MDENSPGGLKFNLDSVLSRPEPGPTFPPLLLVTGQYYLTCPMCIVYGLRDDSHDFKTAFWRCAHLMLALVPVVTRQNPGQT